MSCLILVVVRVVPETIGALVPLLKVVGPENTLASSHKFSSIKVCKVCAPPSIITDCILCEYKIVAI